ncbi:hypothetical protein DL764_009461 [Monosporascus ibericus]|uniref:ER membrane protein complex subunit 7 beta-sandwich domain-containing protein n=1 Tax=Monosporascus ibericus TaxID=155417 RepID=A0A4Q4SUZ4_9PEZI|nr:hypothetical protein DL764_009461 [Monosporascus ibericus]
MQLSRLPLTILSLLFLGGGGIFAAASSVSSSSSTVEITLTIPASPPHLPNPHALPPGDRTRATLTRLGASYAAPLSAAGTFVFRNVTPGSYLADVHSATHVFAPLRVDVDATPEGETRGVRAWETFRGNAWENRGEEVRRTAAGGALPVRVLGPKAFFVERGSWRIPRIRAGAGGSLTSFASLRLQHPQEPHDPDVAREPGPVRWPAEAHGEQ